MPEASSHATFCQPPVILQEAVVIDELDGTIMSVADAAPSVLLELQGGAIAMSDDDCSTANPTTRTYGSNERLFRLPGLVLTNTAIISVASFSRVK